MHRYFNTEGQCQPDIHYMVRLDERLAEIKRLTVSFAQAFIRAIRGKTEKLGSGLQKLEQLAADETLRMDKLFMSLCEICESAPLPIVLMIDEVDSASNNQVFIDFLATLRGYYLKRKNRPTFHSVILAGVYDIKNLKLKMRQEEEHQYNSPWNIAAKFNLDMSFSAGQIAAMLQEYENDCRTEMDIDVVAKLHFRLSVPCLSNM